MAAQIARFTESGALAGANATPSRKTALLPEVVGPLVGNDPAAKLNDVAPQSSSAVKNNFRNSILTMTSIQRLLCLRFLKFAAPGKHNLLTQAPPGVWFGAGDREGARLIPRLMPIVNRRRLIFLLERADLFLGAIYL